MQHQAWVDQVRALLAKAKRHQSDAFANLEALKSSIDGALQAASDARQASTLAGQQGAPYPLRCKWLLSHIRLLIKHYAFADEAQAFVLATGNEVAEQLDNDKLAALDSWLDQLRERMGFDVPEALAYC